MSKEHNKKGRTESITISCTGEEKKRLNAVARKKSMSLSRYLLTCAESQDTDERMRRLMQDILVRIDHMNELVEMIDGSSDPELKRKASKLLK